MFTAFEPCQNFASFNYYFDEFLKNCNTLIYKSTTSLTTTQSLHCFISYCWGPEGEIRDKLQKKLKKFKAHLELFGATVYLDVQDLETNIEAYMDRIQTCDFIFLIGTPALKKRLEEKNSRPNNLQIEFSKIQARIAEKPECLIPLIFQAEGDFSTAFNETLPTTFIQYYNILVRDCRHDEDEWTDTKTFMRYINALSGDGTENGGALGILPVISQIKEKNIMPAYSELRAELMRNLENLIAKSAAASDGEVQSWVSSPR